jgi:hypothetical protein
MTKKEMIAAIQLQEAELFLQAKRYELAYGREDGLCIQALQKWIGVSNMMEALGIQADYSLSQSYEATTLICEIQKQQV